MQDAKGNTSTKVIGCTEYVYLTSLVGRRTSDGVIRGDFGNSWRLNRDRPVTDLLVSPPAQDDPAGRYCHRALAGAGYPLGIYSAVHQYSKFDYFFTSFAFAGASMPTFFFGIMMILLFSIVFKNLGLPYLPPGSASAVRD